MGEGSVSRRKFPLLAVDSGGTKTVAVITDERGVFLGIGKAGSSNHQTVGIRRAKQALKTAIQGALESVAAEGAVSFRCAVLALAGLDTAADEEEMRAVVDEIAEELSLAIDRRVIENDCLCALLGVVRNRPGILLIAGTGSIVFAHDGRGHYFRTGGWGYRVGDEGSGYWIGNEAIRAVLRMHDGRGKPTLLSEMILRRLGFAGIESLYDWVYSERCSVDDVGALATIVEEAAEQGDSVSLAILDHAACELEQLLLAALRKMRLDEATPCPLILQGGVVQRNEYIRRKIVSGICRTHPQLTLVDNGDDPIHNIVRRGLDLLET